MNKIYLYLLLLFFSYVFAEENPIPDEGLLIVGAIEDTETLPANFRMSRKLRLLPGVSINTVGLDTLDISGSAQFSQGGLEALIKRVGLKNIFLVNLRQEEVLFLHPKEGGGAVASSYIMPLSWWEKASVRSGEEIELSEWQKGKELLDQKQVVLYGVRDSALYDKHSVYYELIMEVDRVSTEKELILEKGLGYLRLPGHKFGPVQENHIDAFVQFVRNLPREAHVHFHCRRGCSRTTLLDFLHNQSDYYF